MNVNVSHSEQDPTNDIEQKLVRFLCFFLDLYHLPCVANCCFLYQFTCYFEICIFILFFIAYTQSYRIYIYKYI